MHANKFSLDGYIGPPVTQMNRKAARYEFNRLDGDIEIRGKKLVDPHRESRCLGIERDSIGQLEIVNKAEKIHRQRNKSKRRKILQDDPQRLAFSKNLADLATNRDGKPLLNFCCNNEPALSKVQFHFRDRQSLFQQQARNSLLEFPAADPQEDLVPFDKASEDVHLLLHAVLH